MFETLISGMQAFNQIGAFMAAFVLIAIGGVIFASALYSRLHDLRAEGSIIGVIHTKSSKGGDVYTPVYRYTLPDGSTHEAKSGISSGLTRGKETGRIVPLLVSPDRPSQAREAGSYVFDVIGVVFFLPGILFAYVAFTAYPVTKMTWAMGALLLLWIAYHAHKLIIPREQRPSLEEWRRQHGMAAKKPSFDLKDVKPIEEIISSPEGAKARSRNRKLAPLMGLVAVACFCGSLYTGFETSKMETYGLRTEGTVIRLREQYSSNSDGNRYTYYPVVSFRTQEKRRIEFEDRVGSNPPGYRAGDKVTVLYLAGNPQVKAMIDRGIWNWIAPLGLLAFAVIMGGIASRMWRDGESATDQALSSSVSQ
jgi:hypothetical protein